MWCCSISSPNPFILQPVLQNSSMYRRRPLLESGNLSKVFLNWWNICLVKAFKLCVHHACINFDDCAEDQFKSTSKPSVHLASLPLHFNSFGKTGTDIPIEYFLRKGTVPLLLERNDFTRLHSKCSSSSTKIEHQARKLGVHRGRAEWCNCYLRHFIKPSLTLI